MNDVMAVIFQILLIILAIAGASLLLFLIVTIGRLVYKMGWGDD